MAGCGKEEDVWVTHLFDRRNHLCYAGERGNYCTAPESDTIIEISGKLSGIR